MPYWTYYVTQKAPISLPAKRSHRSGDYIITDHYRLEGDLDATTKACPTMHHHPLMTASAKNSRLMM